MLVVGRGPLVRLRDYESLVGSLVATSPLLACVILRVFHVLHIRDDRFRVEAVLFIRLELLLVKLLAFYSSWVAVLELAQVCVARIVRLSRVMRHL